MPRSRFRPPPGDTSIGMFEGNPPPPQDGHGAIVAYLFDSLTGDAGLRVAYTTGRRLHFSGLGSPQTFVRAPSHPNDDESLEAVPLTSNTRRALSRYRGRPPLM